MKDIDHSEGDKHREKYNIKMELSWTGCEIVDRI